MPIIEAAGASVYNWNGLRAPTRRQIHRPATISSQLLGNTTFQRALGNTGFLIVASMFMQLPLGLAMAALLGGRRWGTLTFRMIFFLPFILAEVAAGLIFHYIFDGDVGLISVVSQSFGGPPVALLAEQGPTPSSASWWPRRGSISAST